MEIHIKKIQRCPKNILLAWCFSVSNGAVYLYRYVYRVGVVYCAACWGVAAAQLAEISVTESDFSFLCKIQSLSSCSEVLLHNTYRDTTPWDTGGKAKVANQSGSFRFIIQISP